MRRDLGPADFRAMPWANGKGVTLELARADRDGQMLWRLSRAKVEEDGPFSLLPGVDRVLTVVSGPGFDLEGEGLNLSAKPMIPLAFSGDLALHARRVTAASDDFNVMVNREAFRARVEIVNDRSLDAEGTLLALYRPASNTLTLTDEAVRAEGGAIAVWLTPRDPVRS